MADHARGKKRRHKKEAVETDPEFQIAPMIDILLVLLVFFMSISSTEILQSNQSVDLPLAKEAKPKKPSAGQVIINVIYSRLKNITVVEVDDKELSMGELSALLAAHVQKVPLMRVYIRADKDVKYDFTRGLLEAIGKAGIANVTFAVVDKPVPK